MTPLYYRLERMNKESRRASHHLTYNKTKTAFHHNLNKHGNYSLQNRNWQNYTFICSKNLGVPAEWKPLKLTFAIRLKDHYSVSFLHCSLIVLFWESICSR